LEKVYDTVTEIAKPNGARAIISTTKKPLRIALAETGVHGRLAKLARAVDNATEPVIGQTPKHRTLRIAEFGTLGEPTETAA
jgi:hypothetical protein